MYILETYRQDWQW